MATAADLNTYMDAAILLIAAESWSAAKTKLLAAWACLIGMPDGDAGQVSMRWDRAAVQKLIDEVDDQISATAPVASTTGLGGGFQFTKTKEVADTWA